MSNYQIIRFMKYVIIGTPSVLANTNDESSAV